MASRTSLRSPFRTSSRVVPFRAAPSLVAKGPLFLLFICCFLVPPAFFAPSSLAARGHEFGFAVGWGVADGEERLEVCRAPGCTPKPGIAGPGKGQFAVPVGVATNEATGDFYVLDEVNGRVERFSADGTYLGEFDGSGVLEVEGSEQVDTAPPTGQFVEPKTIAVDNSCAQLKLSEAACTAQKPSNGDVYVADGFPHKVIDKFTASGRYVGQVAVPLFEGGASLELDGIGVDPQGNLWVAENQGLEHRGFDQFNSALINQFVKFEEDEGARFTSVYPALATGNDGELYANLILETPTVERFSPLGKPLNVVVKRESRGAAVEHSTGDVYVDNVTSVGRFSPGEEPRELERLGEGVLIGGSGIAVSSVLVPEDVDREGPLYVADGGAADAAVFPLEGPKPPTIEGISVSAVTSESALLRAVVNPRGAQTEYRFEYGACSAPGMCASSPYEASVPASGEGLLGGPSDFEGREVSAHPQGLEAEVTYHFRVVARNEKNLPKEFVEASEKVFRTQPAASAGLLDGRDWEIVSPARKHGTRIRPILGQDVIQAAVSGDAFTYVADSPTENEPKGYSNLVQVFSRRTKDGWRSEDIALSHTRSTGQSIGAGEEYRFFSDDLSLGLVQPLGAFEATTASEAAEQTPYLRTDFTEGNVEAPCRADCYLPLLTSSNVAEGVRFGEEGACPTHRVVCGTRMVGASADGRHVILSSQVGLTTAAKDHGGIYEWTSGVLSLVSLSTEGEPVPLSSIPSVGEGGAARGAISADGSRVVWSGNAGKGLYLRDMGEGHSIEVNKGLAGIPVFQDATSDGTRVFFTDNGELYVYELETEKVTRLTKPLTMSEATQVQGKIDVSEDGSYVYFVADGQLTEEAKPITRGCGGGSDTERCYLYLIRAVEGAWQLPHVVATLSGSDFPDFAGSLTKVTSRVSPSGRWLAFMSELPLTGYDNRDAVSEVNDEEVFLYDSASDRLSCASCDPTGARPDGIEMRRLDGGLVAGANVWFASAWLAGNVPAWTPYEVGVALYQSRFVDDSGRVFFNSSDALVPGDVNGAEDVYEFEPVGVGSCTEVSVSFVEGEGGCVGLVSSGRSGEESAFLDASGSGSDVFFLTAAKLVAADFDTALDVYDAHECTVDSPCLPEAVVKSVPCVTESSCKVTPSPQPGVFGAPASSTFSGVGNVSPVSLARSFRPSKAVLLKKALAKCRRKHKRSKRKRGVCERRARATYAKTSVLRRG